MRIISKKRLREFWENHPAAKEPLLSWYQTTELATWQNLPETKNDFPHADLVGECTVFNIGGNKYRLIAALKYKWQMVYVRHVLTHKDYDKGDWKDDCYG